MLQVHNICYVNYDVTEKRNAKMNHNEYFAKVQNLREYYASRRRLDNVQDALAGAALVAVAIFCWVVLPIIAG